MEPWQVGRVCPQRAVAVVERPTGALGQTRPTCVGLRAAAEAGGAPSDPRRTDALPRPAGEGRGEGEGVDTSSPIERRIYSDEAKDSPLPCEMRGHFLAQRPHSIWPWANFITLMSLRSPSQQVRQ